MDVNPPDACPLAAVDRRLEDVHRYWHAAEESYFDPNEFRLSIQTAIQTLRTVTFILQSNKAIIPSFEPWYEGWQQKMRAFPLMRWMVDARNRIEKQGDLETHSFVRAEIIASFLPEGPKLEVDARLFDNVKGLLERIPQNDLGKHILKDGVLRIHRRWVENSLPDYDLLDAVAIAYGFVAEVVRDAHRQLGIKEPNEDCEKVDSDFPLPKDGRLPCMIGHSEARDMDIWMATGQSMKVVKKRKKPDLGNPAKVVERYGIPVENIFGKDSEAEGTLKNLFNTARVMFLKDGYHVSLAIFLKGQKPAGMFPLQIQEHGEKYIVMRSLAHEVLKADADGMIMIAEAWMAPFDGTKPYQRAVQSPDREEFLTATLVTKIGEPVHLSASIIREGKKLRLGDTIEARDGSHFTFAPIYEAWNKPIPKDWIGPRGTNDRTSTV